MPPELPSVLLLSLQTHLFRGASVQYKDFSFVGPDRAKMDAAALIPHPSLLFETVPSFHILAEEILQLVKGDSILSASVVQVGVYGVRDEQ